VAGERAVEYVEAVERNVREAASILGCGVEELVPTVANLLQRLKEEEKESDRLRGELAELLKERKVVILKRSDPRLAHMIYKKRGDSLVVIALEGSPNVMLFGKATELVGKLKEMGAKGGGKGDRVFLTVRNPTEVVKMLEEGSQKF